MPTKKFFNLHTHKVDFYIIEEILGVFLGTSFFILFVLLMFQTIRLAEWYIVHNASAFLLGKLTFHLAFSFLPMVLPISFLISVLVSFTRLSSDSELIAMKACGMSLIRLSLPVAFISIGITVISLFLNLKWVPVSAAEFKKTHIKLGNTKMVSILKEGTFTSGFFDLLLFADKVDTQTNQLHRVFIFDEREPKNPLTYVSQSAEIVPVKTEEELSSAIFLRLKTGSMHQHIIETHTYEKIDFDTYNLYLTISEGKDTAQIKPHMLTQKELLDGITHHSSNSIVGREFREEYWRRFSTSIAPLVFVFLGIGFGTFQSRSNRSSAFLIGFLLILTYWCLQTLGSTALEKGYVPPWLSMSIPNIVLLIVGSVRFRQASW